MKAFSVYHPKEYKIIIMDNAGFHSLKQIELPGNIAVINIPPYSPELNPAEQVWQYIKKRFENKPFGTMRELKQWIGQMVNSMKPETIKSITSNHRYLNTIKDIL